MTKVASDWKALVISQYSPASARSTSKRRIRPLGVILWMPSHSRCHACRALNCDATSRSCCCSEVPSVTFALLIFIESSLLNQFSLSRSSQAGDVLKEFLPHRAGLPLAAVHQPGLVDGRCFVFLLL